MNYWFTTVIIWNISSYVVTYLTISSKEELQFLIHRAWEIEKKFESLSAWKTFLSMGSSNRLTVLTLAKESHVHKLNLEKLITILGLEAPTNEIPEITFDFVGLLPSEMLLRIIEYDDMARELYNQILVNINSKVFLAFYSGKKIEFVNKTLKQMVEDETKHICMVKKITGLIERIQ